MKIVCVGGAAGLYMALLAKLRHPGHEVRVLERDRALATYGWGVVFWDDLLDGLFAHDPVSARKVRQASVLWNGQQVRLPGQRPPHTWAGTDSASPARGLLGILAERALGLGVDIVYEQPVDDPAALPDADLVVAADGAGACCATGVATTSARRCRPGATRTCGWARRRFSTVSSSLSSPRRTAGSGSRATPRRATEARA